MRIISTCRYHCDMSCVSSSIFPAMSLRRSNIWISTAVLSFHFLPHRSAIVFERFPNYTSPFILKNFVAMRFSFHPNS